MATNLEYIYRLKDLYSKRLQGITKKQYQFTQTYKKNMGKLNASAVSHQKIIQGTTKVYQSSTQAISRATQQMQGLSSAQMQYANQAGKNIDRLNKKWTRHSQHVQRQKAKTKKALNTGSLAGMAGGIGAGFFVKGTIDLANEFELRLNRIKSVAKGVNIELMREKAMDWGIATEFSALQIAGAMAEAAQAGMKQNEILKVMPGNIALAASGQMTLVDAMKLSTDVVNQFDRTVSNMRVADYLAVGAATAESTVTELGAALRNTGRSAFMAGLDMKDTLMAVMALGKVGFRGEIGGTFLMNLFTQMKKFTPARQKGFRQFLAGTGRNLRDFFDVKKGQFTDFRMFLDLVSKSSKTRLKALTGVFDVRVIKALESLAGLDEATLNTYEQALGNVNNKALEMQATLMEGLPGGTKLLNSAIETTKLVMIRDFIGPLSKVMRKLAEFLVYLSQNHSWVLKVAFAIISLVAVITALGIALLTVGGAITGFTTMWGFLTLAVAKFKLGMIALNAVIYANPIGLIIAALVSVIGLFAYAWYRLGSFTNALKFMGGVIIKGVLTPINLMIFGIIKMLQLASLLPGVGDKFGAIAEKAQSMQDAMNLTLTGNKSVTQFGMIYDLLNAKEGEESKVSTWIGDKTQETDKQKRDYVMKSTSTVEGNIKVSADPGTNVDYSDFNFTTGMNMAGAT